MGGSYDTILMLFQNSTEEVIFKKELLYFTTFTSVI